MSTNVLPLITQRLFNRPLLIHPQMADALYGILEGRIEVSNFVTDALPHSPRPEASQFVGSARREDGSRRLVRVSGKTAMITIDGSLVNRGAWVGSNVCTGLVSYEGIAAQIDEAANDGGIEKVILDINSYGGEATGMATLAAKVRGLARKKHVVAVVNDIAASAAYGIASGADEIAISPTSEVGSIGVVMLHLDRSAELAAKGIRPTLIHAGAHKVDGNPFGPLPEGVRAEMQRGVMAFYDQFLSVVEAGRGKQRLSVKKARATEAKIFIGQEAIDAGLADRMATFDEVLAEMTRPRSRATPTQSKGSKAMLPENENNAPALTAADHSAIAAELFKLQKADETAKTAQVPAAPVAATPTVDPVKADRDRVAAIMALPEAKGREALAGNLAAGGMSVDAAKAALASVPVATAAPAPDARGNGQELGGNDTAPKATAEQVKVGWSKAFSRARVAH